MNKIFLSLFLIIGLSNFISAQNQTDDSTKAEVFGGYARTGHLTLRENDNLESIENGFGVSIVYKAYRYIGIKADFSAAYNDLEGYYISGSTGLAITPSTLWRSRSSFKNAGAGVQFKDYKSEDVIKPFGHILVGYGKRSGNFPTSCPAGAICPPVYPRFIEAKGVSTVFGGGIDIRINRKIDIRAVQFDINSIFDKRNTYSSFRLMTGIIFKF